ncbi:hypothetical protein Tco_0582981 [Tanacetum coccineum]
MSGLCCALLGVDSWESGWCAGRVVVLSEGVYGIVVVGFGFGVDRRNWCRVPEFDESNTHVLERFYTSAGNHVKEILLKLNLPDHRKLKDGGKVPGPKDPEQAPPSPEFVPKPVYPEFMPPEDKVFPVEEQPLPGARPPTDYLADEGDNNDDDDESSNDDEDDEDDVEDEEEREEYPAPADYVPSTIHRVTARMSIRDQSPTPFWFVAEIDRLLAIPSPPPSPLSPLSSPLPQIPSPPLPVSSPVPVSPPPLPASPTYPLGYRAAMIRLRVESPSTSYPLPLPSPIVLPLTRASVAMMRVVAPSTYILASRSEAPPSGTPPLVHLPTSSPPLLLPSTVYRADTWDEMVEDMQGTPTTTDVAGLSQRMTDFVMTIKQDTNEIYVRLDDAQDDRPLMSSRLSMLYRDRRAYARTDLLIEREARLSCEA